MYQKRSSTEGILLFSFGKRDGREQNGDSAVKGNLVPNFHGEDLDEGLYFNLFSQLFHLFRFPNDVTDIAFICGTSWGK